MAEKIIIAFKTRMLHETAIDPATLSPPANYKDPEKISAWQAEKAARLTAEALFQPYTATFDEVQITNPRTQRYSTFKSTDRVPFGDRQAVCLAVRSWLMGEFPHAWPNTLQMLQHTPCVLFLGFDVSLFLQILGQECSLPLHQPRDDAGHIDLRRSNALPLSLWCGNPYCRDIADAVKPRIYEGLTWDSVLAARGLRNQFPQWKGPHVDATLDHDLTVALAIQLGMLNED